MAGTRSNSVPSTPSRPSKHQDESCSHGSAGQHGVRVTNDPAEAGGVLSRTLIRSPQIHAILPGRIRCKRQHDVVFVGEDFVRLLELQNNTYLEEIATKSFNAPILAAKIIGNPDGDDEDFVDMVVKQEQQSDDEMDWSSGRELEPPPQLLVLLLQSQEIVFLYAKNNSHGFVDFHTSSRALPVQLSVQKHQSQLLATDPKSRSIAFGGAFGTVGVMALKPISQMKNDLCSSEPKKSVMPIVEVNTLHSKSSS